MLNTIQPNQARVLILFGNYAYDHSSQATGEEITLRGNTEEVSQALRAELAVRLEAAGVIIEDARLTHLAYVPEIAQAMLRRQQAEAVAAARSRILDMDRYGF